MPQGKVSQVGGAFQGSSRETLREAVSRSSKWPHRVHVTAMPLHFLRSVLFSIWPNLSPLSSSQNEPKRLKKHLPKLLKLLKPDDRILIVGTTRRPFDAELKSFCKVYQKIILVPRPDYASRYGKYHKACQEAPELGHRVCLQAGRAGGCAWA